MNQIRTKAEKPVRPPLPPWIRIRISGDKGRDDVLQIVRDLNLNTVCQSAQCPNLNECWQCRTATFMILGSECTRNCTFCSVPHQNTPSPPDPGEPGRVAEAARRLNLKYVVITSVTRDDLPDGGAAHFAATVTAIKESRPGTEVEVLTPDFMGARKAVQAVIEAEPTVFNHNLETVERLSREIRSGADYQRSLRVLKTAFELSRGNSAIKSGIMVGLGETDEEVVAAIHELYRTGTSILTIGQYLPPSAKHRPLSRYVHPETFESWRRLALDIGFKQVASAPLVRSSYHADELTKSTKNKK